MFLPRFRALVSVRGSTPTHIVAYLHTTRPVAAAAAAAAADVASYGKSATTAGGGKPGTADADVSPETTTTTGGVDTYTYTKQQDVTPEPLVSHTGTRTYVVSPKDTAPYDVPGGAFGSSDPYLTPPRTPAPQTSAPSSTSSSPAHPNTTSTLRVPHYPEGVGESAAVRFRAAPGAMHTRGGSDGGLGLMDTSNSPAANPLAQRNPPPSEEGGIAGNSEAWKYRK